MQTPRGRDRGPSRATPAQNCCGDRRDAHCRSSVGQGAGLPALTGTRAAGAFSGKLPSGRARRPAPPRPSPASAGCGPPSLPTSHCLSSSPATALDGALLCAGCSSHRRLSLSSWASGCVPALGFPDARCTWAGAWAPRTLLAADMFEEPEWVEAAPAAMGLGPATAEVRSVTAPPAKVSGPGM